MRQKGPEEKGKIVTYPIDNIDGDMSFLEMMDVLNVELVKKERALLLLTMIVEKVFVGLVLCMLYEAHGPDRGVTTCQLHMRKFKDGDTIYIELRRAKAFPIIKDLVVDRSSFDRIMNAGGYISVNTSGNTIDANATSIPKEDADKAFKQQPVLDVELV